MTASRCFKAGPSCRTLELQHTENPLSGLGCRKICRWLLQSASRLGCQWQGHRPATSRSADGRGTGMRGCDNGTALVRRFAGGRHCHHRWDEAPGRNGALVAAGAWTPTLLPWLGDVMWATGQPVLHFARSIRRTTGRPEFLPGPPMLRAPAGTAFRPSQMARSKSPITGRAVVSIRTSRAQSLPTRLVAVNFCIAPSPGLADAPLIGGRLCLYCDTWDGNLWIDHDPERPGLVVAAGDSGHGLQICAAAGRALIADVVERETQPLHGPLHLATSRTGMGFGSSTVQQGNFPWMIALDARFFSVAHCCLWPEQQLHRPLADFAKRRFEFGYRYLAAADGTFS